MRIQILNNKGYEGTIEIGEVYNVIEHKGKNKIRVRVNSLILNNDTIINIDSDLVFGGYKVI